MNHNALWPAVISLLVSTQARTAGAADLEDPVEPSRIYGGSLVGTCEWPSTVWVDYCTATLVHPQMLITAAHCIELPPQPPAMAAFGENFNAPTRRVPIAGCVSHPGWTGPSGGEDAHDIAICQLSEPVQDVPIIPVLMGCEVDELLAAGTVMLVGFGQSDDDQGMGPKRSVPAPVQNVGTRVATLGDATASGCVGDSGGPAFVQLSDGSWRVFGVTSGGSGSCPTAGLWTMMHAYMDWIEQTSGLDITPCYDADGTWNPDDRCGDFPLTPNVAASTWDRGCQGGELSGLGQTCGDPYDGHDNGTTSASSGMTGDGESSDASNGSRPDGTTASNGALTSAQDDTNASTAATRDDSTGGDGPGVSDPGTQGCGCNVDTRPSGTSLLWLAFVVAVARRRR